MYWRRLAAAVWAGSPVETQLVAQIMGFETTKIHSLPCQARIGRFRNPECCGIGGILAPLDGRWQGAQDASAIFHFSINRRSS